MTSTTGDGRQAEENLRIAIEAQKKANQRAQRSELRYKTLFEHAAQAIFIFSLDGRFTEVNQQACASLGYSSEELLKLGVMDVVLDFDIAHRGAVWDTFEIGKRYRIPSAFHRRKDGSVFPVETNLVVLLIDDTKLMMAMTSDISERELALRNLKKGERHLSQAQAIAHIGSWDFDVATGENTWTDELYRIFGVTRETFTPTPEAFMAMTHPDDHSVINEWMGACLSGKNPGPGVVRIKRSDGEIRYLEEHGQLFVDAEGRPRHVSGTAQDITDRIELQRQLNELLAFNKTILEKSPAGISVYRASGTCVMSNEAYARAIGASVENVLKQDFRNNESWRRNGLLGRADQAFETKSVVRFDVDGETTYGKRVSLECIFSPIEISGSPHLLVIVNDVSKRIEAERAVKESMLQLEEKELAKTRFLAAAGHDLRQPLAAASLFIDTLGLTALTQQQDTIVQRLVQSMGVFKGLLDALLNISKLDAGAIKPEFTDIRVAEIFNWLEQNFSSQAMEKELALRLYFPLRETLVIRGDIGLLKSVLMNLVSNAVKYTSHGGILIGVRRRGTDALFQVWDTGMGIAEEHVKRVFEEFYQINNAQRDRTRGLGLGLSIAKRALALQGGEISCRSQLGRGTVFEFRLPLLEYSSGMRLQPEIGGARNIVFNDSWAHGKRFVVVEDDALVGQAMASLLEGMGAELRLFQNAEDALRHANIEHADYFISDCMLGGTLNGIQFLNLLREKLGRTIIAVVMTGDTSSNLIREAEECAWPMLHKPLNMSELFSCIAAQEGNPV